MDSIHYWMICMLPAGLIAHAVSNSFSLNLLSYKMYTESISSRHTSLLNLDRVKRIWYLSPMRAAKVQASLRIRAVSPEPPLLAHTSSESSGTFRQKARSLAPLNGWAGAIKICHDRILEDTNSLDGAHLTLIFSLWHLQRMQLQHDPGHNIIWAPSSEFVSSSFPTWQILTAHVQPFSGARELSFCLEVPLDSLLGWTSSGGSGETARMRRLAWTFAACIGDKYQIRLTQSIYSKTYMYMFIANTTFSLHIS